ncbi:DNA helicase [Tanacetum coccineum]
MLHGTPIQANMDIKDASYFDQLLQLHKAYRISSFSCEQTGLWERTLENPTSLIFGRFIDLEEIPADAFPEHDFNFASYNELATRADVRNAILTDYIGRIQAVSRIYTSGDVTTNQIRRRIIDIQNLTGDTIALTLWHEMVVNFNLQEYESMERPVVIAVSSCWVRRFHALGWLLKEIHLTWARLEKKRTRLRLYTNYFEEKHTVREDGVANYKRRRQNIQGTASQFLDGI